MAYIGYRGDPRYAPYQTDRIEVKGRRYIVEYDYDDCSEAPWEREDGRGVVRKTSRDHRDGESDKAPGERPMNQGDRNHFQYYFDVPATRAKAKRDGWGLNEKTREKFVKRFKREPKAGERLRMIVEDEYDFLRGWVNDDWHYCIVRVTDVETGVSESLGGIESCAKDYLKETVLELVDQMNAHVIAALLSGQLCLDGDDEDDEYETAA